MEKSKIKSFVFKREIPNGNSIFVMELENGVKGDIFSKNPPDFKVGDEIEYEYKANANPEYNGSIKISTPKKAGGGAGFVKKNEKAENARAALRSSTDLVASGKITEQQLIVSANKMFDWLEEKSKE